MSLVNISDKTFKIRACRICLDSKCLNMVLLDVQNEWLKLFEYCFGISLTIQDEPRILCKLCADNVLSYSKFKEQCHKSDNLWKSVIYNVKYCTENNVNNEDLRGYLQNVSDPNINMMQNKESYDNDSHFLHDVEPDFDSIEIKVEDDTKDDINPIEEITLEETNIEKLIKIQGLDALDHNDVDLKGKLSKDNTTECSNLSIKAKVQEVYTCKNCDKKYAKKKCYHTHLNTCKTKNETSYCINNLNHAVICERLSDNKNVAKVNFKERVANIINELKNDQCIEDDYTKSYLQSRTEFVDAEITEPPNISKNQETSLFFCGLCKLTFTSIGAACKHLDEHWSNNDLSCKLCEFVGVDLASLAVHRFSHYPPKYQTRLFCHICEKRKLSLFALQFHYRLVHLKKNGGLCSKCNREFTKLRAWKKHERTHGTGGFICDICGKRYIYKHQIKDHVIEHTNPKQYICDACGKIFKRARYLQLHLNSVHVKTGPIKCSHCNRMFKSVHTLNIHQRLLDKKKLLKCEVCFKEFHTPNKLKSHMVMHSDERPHCCHICGSRYKAKGQLKIHMRNHTGDLPFQCELCTKAFATTKQLKVHTSVHTGVRAYQCSNCERTFHSKKLMLAHCALHHKIEKNE